MRTKTYLLCAALILSVSASGYSQEISKERLREYISALRGNSGVERKAGSPGSEEAAEYIAGKFAEAGLQPFFAGQYIDEFTAEPLVGSAHKTYRNVAGIIYGNSYQLDGEYIVVGAHYDYLGQGESPATVVEDNTSGVAALLEMAFALKECAPGRNVIFAAFDGFELGLLGSRRFVAEGTIPPENIVLMVDLQRVGSMPEQEILYSYARHLTQKEADYFVEACKPLTLTVNPDGYGRRSDTEPFASAGIPAIHISSGPEPEAQSGVYTETIDPETLAQVTRAVADAVCELSNAPSLGAESGKTAEDRKRRFFIEGGITASAGSSFVRDSDAKTRGKTMFSYGAGLYGQINLSYFALRPQVEFIRSGSRYSGGNIHMNSVVVPVSFVAQTPRYLFGSVHIFVGGYYRYTFSGKEAGVEMDFSDQWYRNGAGIQWGIGLKFRRFGLEVNNRYGLTDMLRSGSGKLTERATYGTLSYKF
ncbi:MAG: M28 family peptidase [Rikenellaceae bacterium]|nr:M28 family peptidase [Rikenellaceae bacterium]